MWYNNKKYIWRIEYMKRIIALILVLVTCVSLVSCQNSGNTTGNGDTATGAPYEVITNLMKKTNCWDMNSAQTTM